MILVILFEMLAGIHYGVPTGSLKRTAADARLDDPNKELRGNML